PVSRCHLLLPAGHLSLLFYAPVHHRDLHSFPTRRSSDLQRKPTSRSRRPARRTIPSRAGRAPERGSARRGGESGAASTTSAAARSEEHTSELQSPYDLVCRLLLEKKKKKQQKTQTTNHNP